jgi:predicted RNase H-like HicB family nuclease
MLIVKHYIMKISETRILHLPILVEQDEDDFYIVSCPVFKGCHSYGATIEEALVNIKEVIDMCIEEEKEKASEINRFVGFREMQVPIRTAAV